MCQENKDIFIILFAVLLLASAAGALRGQEPPRPGKTQAVSRSSGLSLNSSAEHSQAWETLSGKFDKALETHEATLSEALRRLRTSELNGTRLSDLLNQSLTLNEDLKNYNQQIGDRMRERDTDLADAYDRINKLEKQLLKSLIAIIIMAVLIAGYIAFTVTRIFRTLPS
jgi:hypothetical protein